MSELLGISIYSVFSGVIYGFIIGVIVALSAAIDGNLPTFGLEKNTYFKTFKYGVNAVIALASGLYLFWFTINTPLVTDIALFAGFGFGVAAMSMLGVFITTWAKNGLAAVVAKFMANFSKKFILALAVILVGAGVSDFAFGKISEGLQLQIRQEVVGLTSQYSTALEQVRISGPEPIKLVPLPEFMQPAVKAIAGFVQNYYLPMAAIFGAALVIAVFGFVLFKAFMAIYLKLKDLLQKIVQAWKARRISEADTAPVRTISVSEPEDQSGLVSMGEDINDQPLMPG